MIVDVKKYKLLAQVIENRMTLLFETNVRTDKDYILNKTNKSLLRAPFRLPPAMVWVFL